MSVSLGRDLIASMNGETLAVKRSTGGAYVAGKWTETVVDTTAFASVQPLTGREIARYPEGDRDRERKKLYSADLLRQSVEGANPTAADVVTYNGIDYQVESVEPWPNYWKCVIVKVEPAESEPDSGP